MTNFPFHFRFNFVWNLSCNIGCSYRGCCLKNGYHNEKKGKDEELRNWNYISLEFLLICTLLIVFYFYVLLGTIPYYVLWSYAKRIDNVYSCGEVIGCFRNQRCYNFSPSVRISWNAWDVIWNSCRSWRSIRFCLIETIVLSIFIVKRR